MAKYLIVGATSGIGLEITKKLNTDEVIGISRGNSVYMAEPNATYFTCDTSLEQPDFPEINEPIDGIIYCPGSIVLKPFRALKPEDLLADFNLNLLGAVKTIQKYLPNLQKSNHASILLFSTVAVNTGMSFHSSIAAAKGAIEGLTRSLAAEFAPKIRVNALAPSLTLTPLADKLINSEAKLTAAKERHPLKNIATAEEIANAAVMLLKSTFITGQILTIDGGLSTIK